MLCLESYIARNSFDSVNNVSQRKLGLSVSDSDCQNEINCVHGMCSVLGRHYCHRVRDCNQAAHVLALNDRSDSDVPVLLECF